MPNAEESEETARGGGWFWILRRREVILSMAGLVIVIFTLLLGRVNDTLLLITPSGDSVAFPDVQASFSGRISGAGIVGTLSAANPSDACESLKPIENNAVNFPTFLLIERGDCNFVTKVQNAQDAGYAAAIVYNNQDGHDLITMSGDGFGIDIPAVFISREAAYVLSQFADDKDARLYLLPALETSAWSILAISSISLLTVSAVLSTFFFVRRQQLRRANIRLLQEPTGLSEDEIKKISIAIYSKNDISNPETCAICLEEFSHGDKLRMLQCNHGFHAPCIDPWLLRRPFCPICKRDVNSKGSKEEPSESVPLLNTIWHSDSASGNQNVTNSSDDIC